VLTGTLLPMIATIVIGDDFPFLLRNVRSGLTGDPLTGATASWELLAEDRLTVVASGDMDEYDDPDYPDGVSFSGTVDDTVTEELTPTRTYYLRARLDDAGVKTSFAMQLKAMELIEAEV
jgi:hypothetical protein